MTSVRHRRRLTLYRILALATPAITVSCGAYAFVADGPWPRIAAGVGAAAAVGLGGMLVRLERRLRVQEAVVRAEQAAEYASIHLRYTNDHREFSGHMVGLLDTASERIDLMRSRLDALEIEVAKARSARPGASTPSADLAQLTDRGEWNDLWPDLSDAPTVVDLVKWDEKNQDLIPVKKNPEPPAVEEQSA